MRILVGDDQAGVLDAARLLLKSEGHSSVTADNPQAVLKLAAEGEFDLILMDLNYARDTTSGQEGLNLLAGLRASGVQTPVVVMTAWGSVDLAVEAMRRGASDFVQKPWDNSRLLDTISRQVEHSRQSRTDLDIARSIQTKLLPQSGPEVSGLDYAARCVPARGIGGDYYDWFDLGSGQIGFLVADVSGKGIGAALLMAHLHGAFHTRLSMGYSNAASTLEAVNRQFWECSPPEQYATLFFARYDSVSGRLHYVNAAHPAPLIVRANGSVERPLSTAFGVGMFSRWSSEEKQTSLDVGDTVLLFSDGVVESGIQRGQEFGEDRLAQAVLEMRGKSAGDLVNALCERVSSWDSVQHDDYTVMALLRR